MAMSVAEDGYVVKRQAIPTGYIDLLLNHLAKVKHCRRFRFRAQGTNSFEKPKLDGNGNLRNSIHNPHLLGAMPQFCRAVEAIVFSEYVFKALSSELGEGQFVNWQTMLFDRSVGTKIHQDTWYLDTVPSGGVFGVWIALEDITQDCGPFKIYDQTNHRRVDPSSYDFDALETDLNFKRDYLLSKCKRLLVRKGDLVIWNSYLFHGSDMPASSQRTRKSLTAHFYRLGAAVQDPIIQRRFSIYDHEHPVSTSVPDLLKAATINPLIYSILCIGLSLLKASSLSGKGADISEIRTVI
jgi:phytanoyl-CoA hydroxylase